MSAPASTPFRPAPVHVPPTGPAALGQPRAFHFLVPLVGKLNAVVTLDRAGRAAAAGWVAPAAAVDGPSSLAAGLLVDEAKLPDALRLRGLVVHVYADDELLCDGTLGAARVGAVGDAAAQVALYDAARDPTKLVDGFGERVLLFEVDVAPACARRMESVPAGVAWARDASLPAPVIVGKPEPTESSAARSDVREALRLVRSTPAFVRAQRSEDNLRIAHRHRPMPLEDLWREEWGAPPSWTRYAWNGEKRAYLSFVVDCPPPLVRVGFDFRETAAGALELLPVRSAHERDDEVAMELEVVDPVVLLDVDADGRLEVIESGEVSQRLRSFDGTERHVSISLSHCR